MLLLLFPLIFGQAAVEQSYLAYPSIPLEALPYVASRRSPWIADFSTAASFTYGMDGGAWVPSPNISDYQTSGMLLVQNTVTSEQLEQENMELRKRIEALENMIKGQVTQPPVTQPMAKPSADGMKSVPGWLVETHQWNKSGVLGEDPLSRALTRNCPFDGTFLSRAPNNMFIYKFTGVYRVKTPGRYIFGQELTCGHSHACVVKMSVDGGEIINFKGNGENRIVRQGVPLTVGDHKLEFVTYLTRDNFIKYQPAERYKWRPMVQAPGDFNLGNFRDDELFAVVPQTVKASVKSCTY
jgi:hypothetical protein